MSKRILLFSISKHTGHFRAAKSIEASISLADPNCEVLSIDAMQFFHPVSSQVIDKMYYFSIKRAPFLWGGIYDSSRVKKSLGPIQRFIHWLNYTKLKNLINTFKPHAVVCTQAFPCGLMAHYKRKNKIDIPLMGVVTDFWPHRFWFYKEVDHYTIASEWAKKRFEEFGYSSDKINVTGIPIHPNFNKKLDESSIRKEWGLKKDLKTVLVMGGGCGLGPIKSVVESFERNAKYLTECQFVVICGKNEKLYEELKLRHFNARIKVVGYTDEVYKLMTVSDIIMSKTGGITSSEVLAKRKLLLALPSIPGQENFNMKFLIRNRMAQRVKEPDNAAAVLMALLNDEAKIKIMQENVSKQAHPDSACLIASDALELCDDFINRHGKTAALIV